jgi:hypothetical protein
VGLKKIAPVDELFNREVNPKPHGAHFKQLLFAVVANCNKFNLTSQQISGLS